MYKADQRTSLRIRVARTEIKTSQSKTNRKLVHVDFDVVLVADLTAEEFQGSRVHLAGLLISPHARVHSSYA